MGGADFVGHCPRHAPRSNSQARPPPQHCSFTGVPPSRGWDRPGLGRGSAGFCVDAHSQGSWARGPFWGGTGVGSTGAPEQTPPNLRAQDRPRAGAERGPARQQGAGAEGWARPADGLPLPGPAQSPGDSREVTRQPALGEFRTFHFNQPLAVARRDMSVCLRHCAGREPRAAGTAAAAQRPPRPERTSRRPAEGGCQAGSHHRLHVQDPQGLGDLDAGVHLPVHAHQEGPVQQHGRVLCMRHRTDTSGPR